MKKLAITVVLMLLAACSSAPDNTAPNEVPPDTAVDANADQLDDDTGTGLDFDAKPHDPDTGPILWVESGPAEDTYVPPPDTGTPIIDTGVADSFTGTVVTFPAPGDLLTGGSDAWWTGTTLSLSPRGGTSGAGVESTRMLPVGRTYTRCRYRIEVTGSPATSAASEPNLRVTFVSNDDSKMPIIKYITAPQILTGDCSLARPYKDSMRVIMTAVCPVTICTTMKVISGEVTLEP